jgi:hypothetical protein
MQLVHPHPAFFPSAVSLTPLSIYSDSLRGDEGKSWGRTLVVKNRNSIRSGWSAVEQAGSSGMEWRRDLERLRHSGGAEIVELVGSRKGKIVVLRTEGVYDARLRQ